VPIKIDRTFPVRAEIEARALYQTIIAF